MFIYFSRRYSLTGKIVFTKETYIILIYTGDKDYIAYHDALGHLLVGNREVGWIYRHRKSLSYDKLSIYLEFKL